MFKTKKVANSEEVKPAPEDQTPLIALRKNKVISTPEIGNRIKNRAKKLWQRKSYDAKPVSRCERPADIYELATWQRHKNEHVQTDPHQPATMFGVPPNYFDMNYRRLPKQTNSRFDSITEIINRITKKLEE